MFPLRLSQLRSVLVRNLDTRTPTQSSCSIVDCFCEIRDVTPSEQLIHCSHQCKQTLNPRWVLQREEERRLEMATVQIFTLRVLSSTGTLYLSTTIDVLELVPLNFSYKALQQFVELPLNTVLFEACGGALYSLPDVLHTLTGKISMSRVPALKELKGTILASSFASTVLRKAYAYQRSTDELQRTAEHYREDVVVMTRREANDKTVTEELELIVRSIQIKKAKALVAREHTKLLRWEGKIDRYEALVYDRAQHVQRIAAQLQKGRTDEEVDDDKSENLNKQQSCQSFESGGSGGSGGSDGSGGGLTSDMRAAHILHLESNLHRMEFLLHARQLKLMYELTTIYPIERIQLEASGHATALRHQRSERGNAMMHRRTSAFEDDLNEKIRSRSSDNLNSQLPQRLPPEIMQSPALSKSAKQKRNPSSASNQVMSIRGLVLPMWENILSSEEEKVRNEFYFYFYFFFRVRF